MSNENEEDDDDSESLVQNDNAAQRLLESSTQRKQEQRLYHQTCYPSMKYLHDTTNNKSRTKVFMTDLRKSMTPRHLELLMFLRMNIRLWN